MRILSYVEESGLRGGIEVFAERQAEELRSRGHEVVLARAMPAADAIAGFDEVLVHKCSAVGDLERFPAEKTVLYVHDHEAVCPRSHAYTPLLHNCTRRGGIWPCAVCAALCRRPGAALKRVFSQRRRVAAMSRVREIVVISQFMKSRLVANGVPERIIRVVPPPPPPKAANPAPLHERPLDMLFAGQLIRGKGVDLLLKAMSRMKNPRTLDVVGTGNMETRLKRLAVSLGVEGRVTWHGFQNDATSWMARAKTVVVPSFWQEPYGLVAPEALSQGAQVVAFATGGLPEACGGKAVLVPPGDIAALAAALDRPPSAVRGPVRVFVFIDALGWKQAERYDFLRDMLPYRACVEMQFGYSCTAIPTILTGKRPAEHGHLAFYDYAPAKSPFRALRFVAPLLRPKSLWNRGRVRSLLSRLVKRLYGFTGYFQLYSMPFERLGDFDYCEKSDIFAPGGLAPIPNLADVWKRQNLAFHISDWRKTEDENFRIAENLLRSGALDRAFVYSAAFDAIEHENTGRDDVLQPKVERYAQKIRALHDALAASGREFELTVISDHGMTPLRGTLDAPAALAKTGLMWGEDYASAIDSTMVRFWWLKEGARAKAEAAFAAFPGRWLTEDEQRRYGIWREDRKFGDAIFLAEPGWQFCPGDMGAKPLNGMHGYDPADSDSAAAWLSTAPVPAGLSRVCDYFAAMTRL